MWEDHRLLVKQDGGFVVQHICTNNAPKGDCFRALIQICGVYLTSNSSRLRISMKVGSLLFSMYKKLQIHFDSQGDDIVIPCTSGHVASAMFCQY